VTSPREWQRIDAALDEILGLAPGEWSDACRRLSGGDTALRLELESLLAQVGGEDPLLDFPAGALPTDKESPRVGLAPGVRIGAYRVMDLLGVGGMGEVYRAERADGQFDHQVAIKLMRREVGDRPQRFHAERQILARLEHPNIAGLHDGGIAEDGRPFMVMDLVVGQSITRWCENHRSTLEQRLTLFLAVCDGVAYAHRKLVIHRDLKPNNVFVSEDGQPKLLDFGVARLLDQTPNDETRHGGLTPSYAAPEQLTGGQITTATDVYALGVLLFELLTGANPWGDDELPLGALVGRILDGDVPTASKFAASRPRSPIPPKKLSGDLDAIIAKAVRKEPDSRYASVTLLQADLNRMLRSEPISARDGARLYVAGRFVKRHRWGLAASSVIAAAVLTAAVGIAWQGHVAKQQAARALAVKNFLVAVFRASDPRIATDKPRGQITAKELLDGSVARIDHDFANQPELQLELLGIAAEIYGYLLDDERYDALMKQRVALARRLYGDHHPVVIEGAITDAWANIYSQNFAEAKRELDEADGLLRESHLDQSALRAEWWLARDRALASTPNSEALRRLAVDRAIALFARYDPLNKSYPAALANAAVTRVREVQFEDAATLNARAIDVAKKIPDHDDMDLALIYANQSDVLSKVGKFDEAEKLDDIAAELVRRTIGEHYGTYWRVLGLHAAMLYQHGDRVRALTMFSDMLATIPADWKATTDDTIARETYAEYLTQEGRAVEAVPLLEAALKVMTVRPLHDFDLRHLQMLLADAYEQIGRLDAARSSLQWALEDYEAHEPRGRPSVLEAQERWARFLIDHPRDPTDLDAAGKVLGRVVEDAQPVSRYTVARARAHIDLARLALADSRPDAGLLESDAAATALRDVQSVHDVRIEDDVVLVRAEALARLHRLPEARACATAALTAALRHDGPRSVGMLRAQALVGRLAARPST
jgi:serine/threonine protein kinase/tetratricopeptide (TPR) repeat protein